MAKKTNTDKTVSQAAAPKPRRTKKVEGTEPVKATTTHRRKKTPEAASTEPGGVTEPVEASSHRSKKAPEVVATLVASESHESLIAVVLDARQEPIPAPEPVLVPAPAPQPVITREDVARLAFTYWERRGRQGGSPDEDWLRAERELCALFGR